MTLSSTLLASGADWRVTDVVCTAGARDTSHVQRHDNVSIALVTDGSFQYRTAQGAGVTPGAYRVRLDAPR